VARLVRSVPGVRARVGPVTIDAHLRFEPPLDMWVIEVAGMALMLDDLKDLRIALIDVSTTEQAVLDTAGLALPPDAATP
jgi:hypothetical protein